MSETGTKFFLGGAEINQLYLGDLRAVFNPFTSAPGITQSGLQVWLDAGNSNSYPGSGTTWTDLTGNGYNATLVNTPTFSSSNGGYLDFNGTNQYATLYGFPGNFFSTGNWTIQFWSYWDTLNEKALLSQGTTTNDGGLHLITRNVSSVNRYIFGMYVNDMTSNGVAESGAWKFTTWTYNDSSPYTKELFVQTTSDKSQSGNAYIGTANNTEIGRIGWSGFNSYYYDGRIAQMYIYNRILSSDEITQNYNASKGRYGL